MQQLFRPCLAYMLCALIVTASPANMAGQSTAKVAPDASQPWPRVVYAKTATLSIYQPQVESWTGNVLKAYAAVKVKTTGKQTTDYGVVWFTANTEVDKVNRVVTLDNFNITKQSFPTLANNGSAYASDFTGELPWNQTIPLDMLESALAVSADAGAMKSYEVQNSPPADYLQHDAGSSGSHRRQARAGTRKGPSPEGNQYPFAHRVRHVQIHVLPRINGWLDVIPHH